MSSGKATVETLRGFRSFDKVLTHGILYEKKPITAFVCIEKAEKAEVLVGFAIRRDINKAVKRNEIRRQMREAFRINKDKLLSGILDDVRLKIVFMYASNSYLKERKKRYRAILEAMDHICSNIRAAQK